MFGSLKKIIKDQQKQIEYLQGSNGKETRYDANSEFARPYIKIVNKPMNNRVNNKIEIIKPN